MRTHSIACVVLALAFAGCSQDVGERGASLRMVDAEALTSQVLYMVPELAATPFTSDQLAEEGVAVETAIPIRVEIVENLAVAWFAPDGEPIFSRDTIVAIWPIVNAEQISNDELSRDGTTILTPDATYETAQIEELALVATTPTYESADAPLAPTSTTTPAEDAIVDFFNRVGTLDEAELWEQIVPYHPGCL